MSGLSAILKCLDRLTQWANAIGSLMILGLILLIGADVLGRNLIGNPIRGVPEIVSLSIVAIVFLQAPNALRSGRLTRSEGMLEFVQWHSPQIVKYIETVFDMLGGTVMLVLIYAHWPILVKSINTQDYVGAVGDFTAPTWPAKLMLLIGSVLITLQFLANIARRWGRFGQSGQR